MDSNEILAVVESVSTEKGLEDSIIYSAIEIAIASASQRHFHEDAILSVEIDRDSGTYKTLRTWTVEETTNPEFHIESHKSPEESN